jgi:transposase InsO family protein
MRRAGLQGVGGRSRWKRVKPDNIAADLVKRDFARPGPNQLWVTDITEHPTREGKVYCCVVLDTYSRRVVGWSIDSSPTAALATNALGMAIDTRLGNTKQGLQQAGTTIHSDQGVQGGFNRSSQHLDPGGGAAWRRDTGARRRAMRRASCVGSGVLTGRCGRRCVHRVDPTPRERCSGSSGG